MKPEEKFNLLKDKYIRAYRDNNGKDVVSLEYNDGYVWLDTSDENIKFKRKHRVSEFERMTINLEKRLINKI